MVLQEFKNHIKTNFPELLQSPFLLACSGGVDSVVLTHLCALSNLNFSIAHCNFKLRGADSEADAEFVEKLAINLGIKLHTTSFKTAEYIKKNRVSLQMAARELRYGWFTNLLRENNYTTVVTGHQADDNLETFIINLSRGTGIDGLIGIPSKTEIATRPLLPFTRVQILDFAKENNIAWQEDISNKETKYLRNNIRHKIVPLLKELHPSFLNNFVNTQAYLQQTSALAENHINLIKRELFIEDTGVFNISIPKLQELSPLNAYVYSLFKDYGFTEWGDVVRLLTAMSGKEVRSKSHRLLKDRDLLLLKKIEQTEPKSYLITKEDSLVTAPLHITLETVKEIKEQSNNVIYVDKGKLIFPLVLRKWEQGDVFYPLGLKGKKKLSKFFKDEKMDVFSKENQWLLCSGDAIVWVVGRRLSDKFKLKENHINILKISNI